MSKTELVPSLCPMMDGRHTDFVRVAEEGHEGPCQFFLCPPSDADLAMSQEDLEREYSVRGY